MYGNLILQTYDYFKDSSSTKLLTRLNRVLSKVSMELCCLCWPFVPTPCQPES